MSDSVQDLAHDHREINRQVFVVAAALRALTHDPEAFAAFTGALSGLHNLLFSHFAREEEGLFPFLGATFPNLAERVHEMTIAHDTICGALTRALSLASTPGSLEAIRATYERFEVAYSRHASQESALLHELEARLDAGQRAVLVDLIDGL